jgi:hypothetical protein
MTVTNLTVSSGTLSTSTYALTVNGDIEVNGIISIGSYLYWVGSNVTLSGTGSFSGTGNFVTQTGDKIIAASASLTFSPLFAISGNITVTNNGSVTLSNATSIYGTVVGSTWVNASGSSLSVQGQVLATGTLTASASSNTVRYYGSTAQTIYPTAYNNLTIDKSAQTASLSAATVVSGNLTISAGTFSGSASNYDLTVKGNFTNNGTFTYGTGTVTLDGTGTQTISGTTATTFYKLTVNKASGSVTLSSSITVNNTLTLTKGVISTGSNSLILPSTGAVSGGSALSYVDGKLQKNFATGSNISKTFEIGSGGTYQPLTLTFASITTAGNITASVFDGDHAQLSTSCISTSGSINRYWRLTNTTVAPVNFSAVFNFNAADQDANVRYWKLAASRYASSTWTTLTVSSRTSTSVTVTGITAFADYAIGENNPKITQQPANATICGGNNTSFSVTASGSSLSYQWQLSTTSGSSWGNVSNAGIYSGATTATLSLTSVQASANGYLYRCIVSKSGSCINSDTSSNALLTISSSFSITSHPSASQVCPGATTSFSITATGAITGYQWRVNTGASWANVTNGGIYSGATTATLTLTGVTTGMNGYLYRCVVTSGCSPNDTSLSAQLSLYSAPSISSNPVSTNTACEGGSAAFSVTASGTGLAYQWQEYDGTSWSDIATGGIYSGATSSSLTISPTSFSLNGYQYRCVVSGTCTPSATSSAATLNLLQKPTVTTEPSSAVVYYNVNRNTSFSLTATGAGTLTYQWQENDGTGWVSLTNGGLYSGVTTNTLSITNTTLSMDGYLYRCVVSGSCSPAATSASAVLNVSLSYVVTSNMNWSALSPTPTSSSTIEVKAGATLTVDVSDAVCGSIKVGRSVAPNSGNGTLKFNSGSSLIVSNTGVNVTLGESGKTGSLDMTSGGYLKCNGISVSNLGTWTRGSGTLEIAGNSTIPSGFTTFNNLVINSTLVSLGAAATVSGDLTIDTSATFDIGGNALTISGNFTNNGALQGTANITLNGTNVTLYGSGDLFTSGTFTLSTGNKSIDAESNLSFGNAITISGAITVTNYGTVSVAATGGITGSVTGSTWVNAAGSSLYCTGPILTTGTLTATASGNTVTYNNLTAAQTVKASAYYNLAVDKLSQTATISAGTSVAGTLSLYSGVLATGTNLTMGSGSMLLRDSGTITGTLQGSNAYDVMYTGFAKATSVESGGSGLRNLTLDMVSGEILTLDRNLSLAGNATISSGTLDVSTNSYSLTVKGNLTNNANFTARSGTVTFSGTSSQTISGSSTTTFNNLTINNSLGVSLSSTNIVTSGTLTLTSGTLSIGTNTLTLNGAVSQGSGAMSSSSTGIIAYNQSSNGQSVVAMNYGNLTFSNYNKTLPSSGNVGIAGTFSTGTATGHTVTGSTVIFNGGSAQSIPSFTFDNLTLNNSAGANLGGNVTVGSALSLSSGVLAVGANTLTLNGTVSATSGSLTSGASGTVNYNQGSNGQTVLAANYGHLTFSNYNKTLPSSGNVGIAGTFTTGTATGHTLTGSTVVFNGSSAQTIPVFTFNNLTLNNSTGGTLSGNITVGGALTLTSGTLAVGSNTLTLSGSVSATSGALTSGTSGTVNYNQGSNGQNVLAVDYGNLTFSNYDKTLPSSGTVGIAGTFTPGSSTNHTVTGSTVAFKGTTQNIPAFTFNNLTVSTSGTKALTGAVTVNGNLSITGGTLDLSASNYALTVKGNFTNSASFNGRSSTVTFNGTSAQTLSGPIPTTFYNLVLNNSSGLSLSNAYITISNTLTLTSGTFSVGSNRLTLNGTAIAGTATNLSTTSGSALVIGGSATSLTLPTSVTALRTLWLNNSNGLNLAAGLTLTDSLYFQSGKLTLENYNLTVQSTGIIAGHDSTKYVVTKNNMGSGGVLIRYVPNNDAFVAFPVGTVTSFSPAKIKLTVGSTADNFKVRVVNNMYAQGTTGAQLAENMLKRTWLIEEAVPGGSNATVNLGWVPTMEGNNLNTNFLAVTHFNGTQWTHAKSFGNYGSVEDLRWRAGSGFTSFSPFSVVDGDMAMDVPFDLKAFFECCYNPQAAEMSTELNANALIPLSQPYNTTPWGYNGTESVNSIPNANVVDWVLVDLRDASSAAQATGGTQYARKAGFLLKDGSIVEADGITPVTFSIKPSGNYYVVINHRNHLSVMSANAITYVDDNYSIDFTNSSNVYGGAAGMTELTTGVYGLVSGMVETSDTEVNGLDKSAAWDNKNKSGGYFLWDCTLDGNVDAADRAMIFNNQHKVTQVP